MSYCDFIAQRLRMATRRGGRIGRALVSGARDRGFETMVDSNQRLTKLILVAHY